MAPNLTTTLHSATRTLLTLIYYTYCTTIIYILVFVIPVFTYSTRWAGPTLASLHCSLTVFYDASLLTRLTLLTILTIPFCIRGGRWAGPTLASLYGSFSAAVARLSARLLTLPFFTYYIRWAGPTLASLHGSLSAAVARLSARRRELPRFYSDLPGLAGNVAGILPGNKAAG